MRILNNGIKVFGFDELNERGQDKALSLKLRMSVNDYEFYSDGELFPYTNDIDFVGYRKPNN